VVLAQTVVTSEDGFTVGVADNELGFKPGVQLVAELCESVELSTSYVAWTGVLVSSVLVRWNPERLTKHRTDSIMSVGSPWQSVESTRFWLNSRIPEAQDARFVRYER